MGHGVDDRLTPPARLTAASAATVAATLQALTAPSRLLLLSQLRQGSSSVGELTAAVAMEQSAVSHQLRLLRTMGLVTTERRGRHIVYSLYDDHVAALLDEAVWHAEHLRLAATDRVAPDVRSSRMQTVYGAAGGTAGLQRLADAWHTRVMADEVVSHAFRDPFHPDHTQRLALYWAEALGGPTTYSQTCGTETSVVAAHSGNGEHDEMNERAITCFDGALEDVGLADDDRLRQVLHDWFARATTTTMYRCHSSADDVPAGLTIPRWSWSGLEPDTRDRTAPESTAPPAGDHPAH